MLEDRGARRRGECGPGREREDRAFRGDQGAAADSAPDDGSVGRDEDRPGDAAAHALAVGRERDGSGPLTTVEPSLNVFAVSPPTKVTVTSKPHVLSVNGRPAPAPAGCPDPRRLPPR